MPKVKGVNRGMVERFIAPVLKTGEPLRVPGVRIPLPLRLQFQSELKPRIPKEFEAFFFYTSPFYSKLLNP